MNYRDKYIKYKSKYLALIKQIGGNNMIIDISKELISDLNVEPLSLLVIKYKKNDKFNFLICQKSSDEGIKIIANFSNVNLFDLKISNMLKLGRKDLINLGKHQLVLGKLLANKARIQQEIENYIKEKEKYIKEKEQQDRLKFLYGMKSQQEIYLKDKSNKLVELNSMINRIKKQIKKNIENKILKESIESSKNKLSDYEKRKSNETNQLNEINEAIKLLDEEINKYKTCLENKSISTGPNVTYLLIEELSKKIQDSESIISVLDTITIYNIKNSDYPSKSLYVNIENIEKGRVVRIDKANKQVLLNYIWETHPYKSEE